MDTKEILGYAAGSIGSAVLAVIILPLLSWYFPADDIGRIVLMQTAAGLTVSVLCLGLDQAYVREYYAAADKDTLFKTLFLPPLLFSAAIAALLLSRPSLPSEILFSLDDAAAGIGLVLFELSFLPIRFLLLVLRMEGRALAFSSAQLVPKLAILLLLPLTVGTWLSFGLVAALIWACAGRLYEGKRQTAVRGQWAASVLSLVLLGYLFASLPLVSPLVNAVSIPWFSWVLTPLALLGSVVPFAPLQQAGAFLAEYTLRFLVWLADVSPEFAVAAAPLPLLVLAVCAALLLLLPRGLGLRPWAVLLLAGFVSYRPEAVPENEAAVTVWDAGQGLSVLVRTANRHLLFDTGTVAAAQTGIVPSLNAAGVRRLDKLVLSHHDSDHDGGFQAVGKIPNGGIYAGQPEFYEGARHCAEQRWQWDGVDFEFLRPSERKNIDDNGKSCVLRVVAGGAALLVTGDLDTKGEESLVGKYGGNLYSQVLVLGHHGSNTSSSGVFLNAVSPEYAVASSGYANAYKHPTEAVQNRVRAHGIKLLRTDLSGALQFGLGRGGVKAQRLRVYKFYWQKKPFE